MPFKQTALGVAILAVLPLAAPAEPVTGRVFVDSNANGRLDSGEKGLADVPITDGVSFVRTDVDGTYRIDATLDPLIQPVHRPIVSVCFPSGYWPTTGWFRRVEPTADAGAIDFALRPDAQPLPFVFVHATDAHVPRGGPGKFAGFRQDMTRLAKRVRFCVLTGDNVSMSDRRPPDQARDEFNMLADQVRDFPVPMFLTPGNHDVAGVEAEEGWTGDEDDFAYGLHWKTVGPLRWSFNYGGVHFVGIDFATREGQTWKWGIPQSAVDWLARDLAMVEPETRVILFVHYPQGPDKFTAVLKRHNVVRIFAGHAHQIHTTNFQGIGLTLSGSLSEIHPEHVKEFLPGYRIVTVTEDALETQYVATGKGEDLDRTKD